MNVVLSITPLQLKTSLHALRTKWQGRALGLQVGHDVVFNGKPAVTRIGDSQISLGDRVVLNSTCESNALNLAFPVTLKTMEGSARIAIGNDTGISGAVIVARRMISIGDRVLIGANCMIMDSDQHDLTVPPRERRYAKPLISQAREVVIEDDVFLGVGCMVLKGVRIGQGSIVGAGSIVTTDIPAFTLAAGNPCRIIRPLRRREADVQSPGTVSREVLTNDQLVAHPHAEAG